MSFTPMSIAGAWVYDPKVWTDERGTFHEVFKLSAISEQLGRGFEVKQVNQSLSRKGVIRGIHWTNSVYGQAKYVSCIQGSIWDVVVDLRPESPTFGNWDAIVLSYENRRSILISEGIGHGFLSLSEGAVANYLCSSEFNPADDRTINPLSKKLGISFEEIASAHEIESFLLSDKDKNGETFNPATFMSASKLEGRNG